MRLRDLFLKEIYSQPNTAFRDYMRDEPIDHYVFWREFPEWAEENGYSVPPDYDEDDPEQFYSLPAEIQSEFAAHIRDNLLDNQMQNNPVETPTYKHAMLNQEKLLPRSTWLVHFTDDPQGIAMRGFTHGVYDMAKLGLTTYYKDSVKSAGGYNFAFEALSRDAMVVAGSDKYGRNAVLFQSSGVSMAHHGDDEDQVVFWGSDVDFRSIIVLVRSDDGWCVMPHPTKSRRFKSSNQSGAVFIPHEAKSVQTEYASCVKWTIQNYRQYAKIITGW